MAFRLNIALCSARAYTGQVSRNVVSLTVAGTESSARSPDRGPRRTIRKILDAGLIELRGPSHAGLSMRAVAARAGVSPACAYRHFPSKDVLVARIYFELLKDAPMHVDVNQSTVERVTATMHDMALVGVDEPELTAACATALMADDSAMLDIRIEIGAEVRRRVKASLGPGWPEAVHSTLEMTFAGALMSSRFLPYDRVTEYLDTAVELILASSGGR